MKIKPEDITFDKVELNEEQAKLLKEIEQELYPSEIVFDDSWTWNENIWSVINELWWQYKNLKGEETNEK